MAKSKGELIQEFAEKEGLTIIQSRQFVDSFLDLLQETVKKDEKVTLVGFGTFEVKTQAARIARNPKTGEKVNVPERRKVVFRPSNEFKYVD